MFHIVLICHTDCQITDPSCGAGNQCPFPFYNASSTLLQLIFRIIYLKVNSKPRDFLADASPSLLPDDACILC